MTELEKISYALGLNVGSSLAQRGFCEIDAQAASLGLEHSIKGGDLLMSNEEAAQVLHEFMQQMQGAKFEANKHKSDAFMEGNKTKPGINITESGLQYQILAEGNGPKPLAADTVTTHYHGMLIDGTVFDSSVQRGEPVSFPVSGVIKGWVEALQMMNVGSKWKLFIPSELAYGANPHPGGPIEPHSALIFEVELLAIAS
jgi:FKBP-type peptidyl-prolyl cis-trans isomerase FklB